MRYFATAFLLLGSVCAVQAQETAPPETNDKTIAAADFGAISAPQTSSIHFLTTNGASLFPVAKLTNTSEAPVAATALALPFDAAEPAAPSPQPKFLYSRSEIDRWELGFGFTWIRFRSSIFNASAVGAKTSISYFLNDWFAVEGNISAAFAPQIFDREHAKLLIYGGGPKVAWRQNDRWEPWLHAILGGAHEQPQTAGNGRNTYSIQLGGGADYHFNPRFSGRLEGNLIRTGFFGQSQNNFQLAAGVVVHF
jgi:hypothetical protein